MTDIRVHERSEDSGDYVYELSLRESGALFERSFIARQPIGAEHYDPALRAADDQGNMREYRREAPKLRRSIVLALREYDRMHDHAQCATAVVTERGALGSKTRFRVRLAKGNASADVAVVIVAGRPFVEAEGEGQLSPDWPAIHAALGLRYAPDLDSPRGNEPALARMAIRAATEVAESASASMQAKLRFPAEGIAAIKALGLNQSNPESLHLVWQTNILRRAASVDAIDAARFTAAVQHFGAWIEVDCAETKRLVEAAMGGLAAELREKIVITSED
jgi:hypothetical protein